MAKTHFSSQAGLGLPIIIVIIAVLAILAGVAVPKFFASDTQVPSGEENAGDIAPSSPVPPAASLTNVTIQNYAFSPKTLTIPVGTTVTFTNLDSVGHTATQDGGGFDTGILAQGQSKNITFSQSGTYAYHCTPHPNMKATIIVE